MPEPPRVGMIERRAFSAWQDLDLLRAPGAPISAEAIAAWLNVHQIEQPEYRRRLFELVSALDYQWRAQGGSVR